MLNNYCKKCDSRNSLKLEDRGTHTALVCGKCGSWQKWVSKKEIAVYERILGTFVQKQSLESKSSCSKCQSKGFLRLEDRGEHTALVCGKCGSWLKWVGKKELSMYENIINNQKVV